MNHRHVFQRCYIYAILVIFVNACSYLLQQGDFVLGIAAFSPSIKHRSTGFFFQQNQKGTSGSKEQQRQQYQLQLNSQIQTQEKRIRKKAKTSLLLHQSTQEEENSDMETKNLVLIGGGHAHLQVIKAFNKMSRPKNLNVILIDMQSFASYSGMVPGM